MKQKHAKQLRRQQKQFGYHGGRLFWSFPVCILFFFFLIYLIYKLSWILKQKLFWKQKKTNWRKMSKKTSKSCKSRHSFPNGCVIFQQEKAWSWHFPRGFNCDSFCGGRKNKFSLPNLECPSHLHRVLFTMGFPLIRELCKPLVPQILPHRIPRFPRAFQQQEQHRQHLLKSRMGLSLISGLA